MTLDIIQQSSYDDSADSECSLKTAFSSVYSNLPLPKSTKSSGQVRPSNLFYNHRVDHSGNNRTLKKAKMVWKTKVSTERVEKKSKSHLFQNQCSKSTIISKVVLLLSLEWFHKRIHIVHFGIQMTFFKKILMTGLEFTEFHLVNSLRVTNKDPSSVGYRNLFDLFLQVLMCLNE